MWQRKTASENRGVGKMNPKKNRPKWKLDNTNENRTVTPRSWLTSRSRASTSLISFSLSLFTLCRYVSPIYAWLAYDTACYRKLNLSCAFALAFRSQCPLNVCATSLSLALARTDSHMNTQSFGRNLSRSPLGSLAVRLSVASCVPNALRHYRIELGAKNGNVSNDQRLHVRNEQRQIRFTCTATGQVVYASLW